MTQEMDSLILRRIDDWRTRLVDLTRRNNLLYFKHTRRGHLTVSHPEAETVFNRLVLKRNSWAFWLPPEIPSEKQVLKTSFLQSKSLLPKINQLVCEDTNRVDLERTLKNLHRRSLSDYRERGLRILHVTFGMLIWKENASSEEIHSPIILVPVELSRDSIRDPFSISIPPSEEDVVLNPALQIKLKKDFNLELPPLPEEWEHQSLVDYLTSICEVVKSLSWRVEQTVTIGLFSFYKLVIYKDLETNADLIAQHPIIRRLSGDKTTNLILSALPDEKDIDTADEIKKTFQILDADSSQKLCIHYALQGQSFVMQGPPGTGKSQTIANMIGECIAQGKHVLFVSDKMAALEVVFKRLSESGLAHFCLELHSQKANKLDVIAELKRCLDEQLVPRKLPSETDFEKLIQLKEKLNCYVDSLHLKRLPLGKSVFDILGQLSALNPIPYVPFGLSNLKDLDPQKSQAFEELMVQLKTVWQVVDEPDFPWRGYRGSTSQINMRLERQDLATFLDTLSSMIAGLISESSQYALTLGVDVPRTFEQVRWLNDIGNVLLSSLGPESSWVIHPNLHQLISDAKTYQTACEWCSTMRGSLIGNYDPLLFSLPPDTSLNIETVLDTISPLIGLSEPKVSELLKRRDELTSFFRNTQGLINEWINYSTELAQIFALPIEGWTIERTKQFARLALLCLSEEKPPADWLTYPSLLQQIQEMLPQVKSDHQEYNALETKLSKTYTATLFELDLDQLIKRYDGPYRSFTKWFRISFYRDQKQIKQVTHSGRIPKSVLAGLLGAQRVKTLKMEIDAQAKSIQNLLGSFYQGYETDFDQIERRVEAAAEIVKLSGSVPVPKELIDLASVGSVPPLRVKQFGNDLRKSLEQWDQTVQDLSSLSSFNFISTSKHPIQYTPMTMLQAWAEEGEQQLTILCELTKKVLDACKNEVPQNYKHLLQDLKNSENVRLKEAEILLHKDILQETFGTRFTELKTNWAEIISILEWTMNVQTLFGSRPIPQPFLNFISRAIPRVPSNQALTTSYDATLKLLTTLESYFETPLLYQGQRLLAANLNVIQDRVKTLHDRLYDLQVWTDFKDITSRFYEQGLAPFLNKLIELTLPSAQLMDVFYKALYQEWIDSVYTEDPHLGRFRRENHELLISEFRKADQALIRLTPNRVIQEANRRKPQGILVQASDAEINILLREAVKKRRIMPIRSLFQAIPHLLFRLKPCLLMSPLSVSQFLTPLLMTFDLILFDEASQIVPEDAIGAIYRGKTVVVAGDDKQLPPTSFFQKSMLDDYDWDEVGEEDIDVFDSILDEFSGIGLPIKTLRWHYRSKHEELITFSNHRFYSDRLITFPSALLAHETLGVKSIYVPDGVYDRGGRRDNLREAEVVSNIVFKHFQQYPTKTLGVVTFSLAQMEAVIDAIERRLQLNPEYDHFFKEDRLQGFFVKNLENVQGDERDVMIFSVGYGRDQQGHLTMNFGPLNKSGGERRLNVAVTRAREKVILVTSLKSTDLTLDTNSPEGVLTLKHYLEYAEQGPASLDLPFPRGDYGSVLEKEVAAEIQRLGYNLLPQVGCSGYRIDLGVLNPQNPGHFILGVECDGSTYLSAYSARDRDRLRHQVLEALNWKTHRIWSPSWVAQRDLEVKKLQESLDLARHSRLSLNSKPRGVNPPLPSLAQSSLRRVAVRQVGTKFSGIEKIGVPYKLCELKARVKPTTRIKITRPPYTLTRKNEFHMPENQAEQRRLLIKLVKNEGPIHFKYAAKRLATAWGLKRLSLKTLSAVRETIIFCTQNGLLRVKDDFLWPMAQTDVPVRIPVPDVPHSIRKLEYIPPEEIETAMTLIVHHAIGISVDSLLAETARLFKCSHTRDNNRKKLLAAYTRLLHEEQLVSTNNVVTAPQSPQ